MGKKQEILDKASDILDQQEFESKKLQLDRSVQLEIVGFLHEQLKKNASKSKLTELLFDELQTYFEDEDKKKEIGFTHLLQLLAIINKSDNDLSLGIMNLISNKNEKSKTLSEVSIVSGELDKNDNEFSKEEMQDAKKKFQLFQKIEKVLDKADNLEKTEFNDDEKV